MTLAQVRALTKILATWLAATMSLLFAVSRFLPSGRPGGYSIIEDAWIQMLHMAFAERLQFGRDVVFTFGPWGFLYGGYHPATYLISVVVWAVLAVVFWWAAWRVVTHFFKNPLVSWLWMMAVIGLASITAYALIDARLTAWPVLLLLLHFSVEERAFTLTQAMLVISLALLSLVKHSIFTIAVVTVLICATRCTRNSSDDPALACGIALAASCVVSRLAKAKVAHSRSGAAARFRNAHGLAQLQTLLRKCWVVFGSPSN